MFKKRNKKHALCTSELGPCEIGQIVSESPLLIHTFRIEDTIIPEFLSDSYAILGYNPSDLMSGKIPWEKVMPQKDIRQLTTAANDAIKSGANSFSKESRLMWASGELHRYTTWNQIIRDGDTIRIQGIQTEISALKETFTQEIKYRERLKALAQDLVRVEDNERHQLAIALHDDIGQMLAALNMKFTALKEAENKTLSDNLVDQVDELIVRIMGACKSLTWQVSPPSLYETDTAAGLERMAADLKNFFGLEIGIQTAGLRIELDKDTSALIFRCAKELLVNVAKHAETDRAEVGISHYNDKVHLVVSDEGKGFDLSEQENRSSSGFGLFSIRERLSYIGGSMKIETAPGQGTKIMMIIPMEQKPGGSG